jgi:hypothetical protein
MNRPAHAAAWTAAALAPLLATVLIFVAVLRSGQPAPWARTALPHEPRLADRCTWSCHNHGCTHAPVLPAALTGDHGLFGVALRGLHRAGSALAPGRPGFGYGLANVLLFCALWPAGMYALWLVALWQRRRLRALRRSPS